MIRAEAARQAAIDRVGDAYVYGAWDQFCTVQSRNKYANLSSKYADAIKKQCQRQSGKKSTCDGCKYNGRRIHDCRGLTSVCAKAAGITTITGQTVAKQWAGDTWERKGEIYTLPKEMPYVQLFRHNGTKWAHTGCYIGNGETVDARGHASGVIRCKLTAYKWTHWAIPRGMYDEIPETQTGGESVIWSGIVTTKSGRLNIRKEPNTTSDAIGSLSKGAKVDIIKESNGWGQLGDSNDGWVSLDYITRISDEPAPDPVGDPAPVDPAPAFSWAVWVPCDNEDEARRYAGDIKRAVIIRYDKPPDAKGE